MQVPPHPHIGLQTVSWLLEGSVHHRDSLGSDQLVQPGALGLMTAGSGIAHAEQSPVPHPDLLHGVQLWVALPDADRGTAPGWEHHDALPVLTEPGVRVDADPRRARRRTVTGHARTPRWSGPIWTWPPAPTCTCRSSPASSTPCSS